jgi:hypothetical protein
MRTPVAATEVNRFRNPLISLPIPPEQEPFRGDLVPVRGPSIHMVRPTRSPYGVPMHPVGNAVLLAPAIVTLFALLPVPLKLLATTRNSQSTLS